jgi:hypothetical protein
MARTRLLHPGLFMDEDLGALSPTHRLLFAGLWTLADRDGRLRDHPKSIEAQLMPWDKVNCNAILGDLGSAGVLTRYSVAGRGYIQITNFLKYQKPHKNEKTSDIPPLTSAEKLPESLAPRSESLAPRSVSTRPVSISVSDPVSISDPVVPTLSGKPDLCTPEEQDLFEFWKLNLKHGKAVLNSERLKLIRKARGLGYGWDDLKLAIGGCAISPHHQGQNSTGTVYDDLALILRDSEHIEGFMDKCRTGLKRPPPAGQGFNNERGTE